MEIHYLRATIKDLFVSIVWKECMKFRDTTRRTAAVAAL